MGHGIFVESCAVQDGSWHGCTPCFTKGRFNFLGRGGKGTYGSWHVRYVPITFHRGRI